MRFVAARTTIHTTRKYIFCISTSVSSCQRRINSFVRSWRCCYSVECSSLSRNHRLYLPVAFSCAHLARHPPPPLLRILRRFCPSPSVVQFVGVLLRPVPSVVTRFMENGSVERLLVMTDKQATKELVTRMGVEAAKGVIHLHRSVMGITRIEQGWCGTKGWG